MARRQRSLRTTHRPPVAERDRSELWLYGMKELVQHDAGDGAYAVADVGWGPHVRE